MSYNIDDLKSAEGDYDNRRSTLLEKFAVFRDNLIVRLQQFSNEAISAGLHGTTMCKVKKSTKKLLEATIGIRNFDLVIVSTDETYPLNLGGEELAAKIFIYNQGNDAHTPLVEIVFLESKDKSFTCLANWFSQNGLKPVIGSLPVDELSGQKVADAVIRLFYHFQFTWVQKPTLGGMLKGEVQKAPFGFIPEQ